MLLVLPTDGRTSRPISHERESCAEICDARALPSEEMTPSTMTSLSATGCHRTLSFDSGCTLATRGASMHLHHMTESGSTYVASSSANTSSGHHEVPPSSLFFNYPSCPQSPSGRWAHSVCSVGRDMIVFGGIGKFRTEPLVCLIFFEVDRI